MSATRSRSNRSPSLLATLRSEFTDSLVLALAPTTETPFSAERKRALVAEATDRRAETAVLRRALDREGAHLADAATAVDEVVEGEGPTVLHAVR